MEPCQAVLLPMATPEEVPQICAKEKEEENVETPPKNKEEEYSFMRGRRSESVR